MSNDLNSWVLSSSISCQIVSFWRESYVVSSEDVSLPIPILRDGRRVFEQHDRRVSEPVGFEFLFGQQLAKSQRFEGIPQCSCADCADLERVSEAEIGGHSKAACSHVFEASTSRLKHRHR